MGAFDLKEFEDWVLKNECFPFEDSIGNLCITVESEYESFGGERDARLNEAKEYGIDRLIRFYGKLTPPTETMCKNESISKDTERHIRRIHDK